MRRRRQGPRAAGRPVAAQGYGTADVARLIGLSPSRVRALVRDGFCRPVRRNRRFEFTFADLVMLRTARALLAAGVPARRVRPALRALARGGVAEEEAALRLFAAGREVVARDGRGAWEPRSGQAVFPFQAGAPRRKTAPLPPASGPGQRRAQEWFQRGRDREVSDPDEAIRCYRRAIACAPELSDAYVNLGRLLYERGALDEATRLFRDVVRRSPDDAVAHYNLALILEDRGDWDGARAHYEHAVRADAAFAEAHHNLGYLLERLGRRRDALRHLSAYRRLTKA